MANASHCQPLDGSSDIFWISVIINTFVLLSNTYSLDVIYDLTNGSNINHLLKKQDMKRDCYMASSSSREDKSNPAL